MTLRLLVDAPSLVYRAFFSWPKTITDDAGRSVNAARGFMDMLTFLLAERRPDDVVCAFDNDWRPAFRVALYDGYKSERAEDPPELPWQFELLAEVLDAAGVPRAEADGLEADDVIATMVESASDDLETHVVTGDRDLLCLVRDPQVKLLFPVKGVREMTEFDEAAVEAKYGIPPQLYPDFAILRGDPSDGLPGVRGVGPKKAAQLLRQHGSLDGLLSSLDSQPEALRRAVEDARDYLTAVRDVVYLVHDAPVALTEPHPPDEARMRELADRHNLGSSATKLVRVLKEKIPA